MPGKQIHTTSRPKSPTLLIILAILSLSLIFIIFSPSFTSDNSAAQLTNHYPNPIIKAETSFVASLEQFLTQKLPKYSSSSRDDTVRVVTEEDAKAFDEFKYQKEIDRVRRDPYYPVSFPMKIYVYDMPSKFTYDLLSLFRNTYKETFNLTSNGSPVHRLIEQHSIDYWLWADLIAPESERLLKNVVRVQRQEDADLFYVPFFTTISYFLMEKQQCKALYRVML